jgi:hypothetical protein
MGGWSFQAGYPQLCEAQTGAAGRLPGTPVQRLATIGHGDGIGATHVTAPPLVHIRITTISTAADTTTTESGGISA